jgi:beta-lactamase superfamily II metal-dependent hydrolase
LKISYGEVKILLAADIGHLGEQRLLKIDANVESQILKAGHHGDSDATSEAFLQKIKPDIAIISVSKVNKYVRPHRQVLDRLSQIKAKIYRTDLHGTILFSSDGKTYSLSTEK